MTWELDGRGDVAIAIIIVYPFLAILSLLLLIRHGFKNHLAWLFLFIFSLVRVTGGILRIVAEKHQPVSTGLYIAAFILEGVGIAPLLNATMAFLALSGRSFANSRLTAHHMRALHIIILVAIALTAVGTSEATSSSASTRSSGASIRKAAALILLVAVTAIALCAVLFYTRRAKLVPYMRTLVQAMIFSLPFLIIRCIYGVLSAFAPVATFTSQGIVSGSGSLAAFSSFGGKWEPFAFMAILMELIVVCIYVYFGLTLPLSMGEDDLREQEKLRGDGYAASPGMVNGHRYPPNTQV